MKESAKGTAIATIAASAIGTIAWFVGWSQELWRNHPLIATFIITIVTYVIIKQLWLRDQPK